MVAEIASRQFWSVPKARRLILWLGALLAAIAVSHELGKWNLFAPGGVLAQPRPFPAFPDLAKHEVDGFWDSTAAITPAEQSGSVWLYFVWTLG